MKQSNAKPEVDSKIIVDNYIYLGQVEYELKTLELKIQYLKAEKRRILVNIESLLEGTHEK